MRNWINIVDVLSEAPIEDIAVHDLKGGTSFTPSEMKSITSDRGIQRYYKSFGNTPFRFKIVFINTKKYDATNRHDNDIVDQLAQKNAGIFDTEQTLSRIKIPPEPDVITFVLSANLSPLESRYPLTPWILAHKVGHAIQDSHLRNSIDVVTQADRVIYATLRAALGMKPAKLTPEEMFSYWPIFPQNAVLVFKTKGLSANPTNNFEIFPELTAKFLINGKINVSADFPNKERYVSRLNRAFDSLLSYCVGKVLVEF